MHAATKEGRPRQQRVLAFARRLDQAADSAGVPPLHSGRLVWTQKALEKVSGESVSLETVRKWFSAESEPRNEKMRMLAEIFKVDVAWLQLGQDTGISPRERKIRNATVDGIVNVVAGFIQMDGGHPAFPDEEDVAAQRNNVDIHAIIRGAKYDFHVSLADDEGVFRLPTMHSDVVVLGVIRDGFSIKVYEITPEVIEQRGQRRGGGLELKVDPTELRKVENFASRL